MGVVKRNTRDFVKLIRNDSKIAPNSFDVEPFYICKLIDAFSNGKILEYIGFTNNVSNIDTNKTLNIWADYLHRNLDTVQKHAIFGEVSLNTSQEFISHFKSNTDMYSVNNMLYSIKDYLNEHFTCENNKFKRKITSHYRNN